MSSLESMCLQICITDNGVRAFESVQFVNKVHLTFLDKHPKKSWLFWMNAQHCLLDKVHIFVYQLTMKTISFFRTASGKCPVKEHLDSLTDVQATKIAWVLKLIRELDLIPSNTSRNWSIQTIFGKPELTMEKILSVSLVFFMIEN